MRIGDSFRWKLAAPFMQIPLVRIFDANWREFSINFDASWREFPVVIGEDFWCKLARIFDANWREFLMQIGENQDTILCNSAPPFDANGLLMLICTSLAENLQCSRWKSTAPLFANWPYCRRKSVEILAKWPCNLREKLRFIHRNLAKSQKSYHLLRCKTP